VRLLPAALAKYGEAESDARRGASISSLAASPSSSRYRREREKFFLNEFCAPPLAVCAFHGRDRKCALLGDGARGGRQKGRVGNLPWLRGWRPRLTNLTTPQISLAQVHCREQTCKVVNIIEWKSAMLRRQDAVPRQHGPRAAPGSTYPAHQACTRSPIASASPITLLQHVVALPWGQ
jgi:hypothetical protein